MWSVIRVGRSGCATAWHSGPYALVTAVRESLHYRETRSTNSTRERGRPRKGCFIRVSRHDSRRGAVHDGDFARQRTGARHRGGQLSSVRRSNLPAASFHARPACRHRSTEHRKAARLGRAKGAVVVRGMKSPVLPLGRGNDPLVEERMVAKFRHARPSLQALRWAGT